MIYALILILLILIGITLFTLTYIEYKYGLRIEIVRIPATKIICEDC